MANDTIQGSIKLLNLLDVQCFESFDQWVQEFVKQLAIELPEGVGGVVTGNSQPLSGQENVIWNRRDNSGTFIGFYVFSSGRWVQVYPPADPLIGLFRVAGSTMNLPDGWQRADLNPELTAAQVAFLQAQWMPDPANPGEYLIFHVYLDV